MKITLSVIKADIGSIGGHIAPSRRLIERVAEHVREHGAGLVDGGYAAQLCAASERFEATFRLRKLLRRWVVQPLHRTAGLPLPLDAGAAAAMTRELLPTLRPAGELVTYVGEAIGALRHGADVVFNVAPSSCMVATMGEVLTPAIKAAAINAAGRVQHLFSADGTVDDELLQLALLKALGPERYCGVQDSSAAPINRKVQSEPKVDMAARTLI